MEDSYLLGERTDIPTTNAFQISDLNLDILELQNGDCVETDIEEHQCPLKERVNCVGYLCQDIV